MRIAVMEHYPVAVPSVASCQPVSKMSSNPPLANKIPKQPVKYKRCLPDSRILPHPFNSQKALHLLVALTAAVA